MGSRLDFEGVVDRYYGPLYQFAFSLTHAEADACDLTQQTFFVWATKGHQLRDVTKVKTWLFTTLHRLFLESRRKATKFPHHDLDSVEHDIPTVSPDRASRLDTGQILTALQKVDEVYQSPVTLFYLEDFSYQEIADVLNVPLGTVKSRISRGLTQLQNLLASDIEPGNRRRGSNL